MPTEDLYDNWCVRCGATIPYAEYDEDDPVCADCRYEEGEQCD